jgi:hypothetical protein
VTTVMATTNARMGATRSTRTATSCHGKTPVATVTPPATRRTNPMIARRMNRILSPGPGILPQAPWLPRPFTHPSVYTPIHSRQAGAQAVTGP